MAKDWTPDIEMSEEEWLENFERHADGLRPDEDQK